MKAIHIEIQRVSSTFGVSPAELLRSYLAYIKTVDSLVKKYCNLSSLFEAKPLSIGIYFNYCDVLDHREGYNNLSACRNFWPHL